MLSSQHQSYLTVEYRDSALAPNTLALNGTFRLDIVVEVISDGIGSDSPRLQGWSALHAAPGTYLASLETLMSCLRPYFYSNADNFLGGGSPARYGHHGLQNHSDKIIKQC